jgi:hypothetical protein
VPHHSNGGTVEGASLRKEGFNAVETAKGLFGLTGAECCIADVGLVQDMTRHFEKGPEVAGAVIAGLGCGPASPVL